VGIKNPVDARINDACRLRNADRCGLQPTDNAVGRRRTVSGGRSYAQRDYAAVERPTCATDIPSTPAGSDIVTTLLPTTNDPSAIEPTSTSSLLDTAAPTESPPSLPVTTDSVFPNDPPLRDEPSVASPLGLFTLLQQSDNMYLLDSKGEPIPQGQGRLRAAALSATNVLHAVFRTGGNTLTLRRLVGTNWVDVTTLAWPAGAGYEQDLVALSIDRETMVVTAGFTTPAGNSQGVGTFSFDGGKTWAQHDLPLFGTVAALKSNVYVETGLRNRGNGSVITTSNGSDWSVAFSTPYRCTSTRYQLGQNDSRNRLIVEGSDGMRYEVDPDQPFTSIEVPKPAPSAIIGSAKGGLR
jgi:hypothetical protein